MDTRGAAFKAFVGPLAGLVLAACGTGGRVQGQLPARQPITVSESAPSPTSVVLQEMTRSAGVIFAGQVIGVRRPAGFAGPGDEAAGGVVEVVFRVDQALRGCANGSSYTLREWAGLWAGGTERYRPGQRLLMFLRWSDANGLNSPVHGAEGAIPLRGGGAAPGPDDTNPEAAEWLVDLRWVQAQAARNTLSPLKPIHPVAQGLVVNGAETENEKGPVSLLRDDVPPWTVATRPVDSEMAPLSQILNLCRGWTRQSHDAR